MGKIILDVQTKLYLIYDYSGVFLKSGAECVVAKNYYFMVTGALFFLFLMCSILFFRLIVL